MKIKLVSKQKCKVSSNSPHKDIKGPKNEIIAEGQRVLALQTVRSNRGQRDVMMNWYNADMNALLNELTGTLKGEELGTSMEMFFSELPSPDMLLRLGERSADASAVREERKAGIRSEEVFRETGRMYLNVLIGTLMIRELQIFKTLSWKAVTLGYSTVENFQEEVWRYWWITDTADTGNF